MRYFGQKKALEEKVTLSRIGTEDFRSLIILEDF